MASTVRKRMHRQTGGEERVLGLKLKDTMLKSWRASKSVATQCHLIAHSRRST